MNKFLVFILALSVNFSFSQASSDVSANSLTNASRMLSNNGLWISSAPKSTKLKGTPYLFESRNNDDAVIFMQDKAYRLKSLNYNIQLERFEAKFSEDSVFAFNPKNIKKVVIEGRTFKRYLDPEFQRNSFFEELAATKSISILRKHEIEIVEASFNPMTQQKVSDDQMVHKEKYYYTKDRETLKETKLKKSAVLKLIDADKKDVIKQYAKDNNLSFKDINDLKNILKHYNTL